MPMLDKERAKNNLDVILDRLHNDTDFSLLKDYKKLFRKKVFLLRRSEVAAWLFMYFDQRETPKPVSNKKPVTSEKKTAPAEDKPSTAGEINLDEAQAKRLFFSIGKNRRLFPREIITLIMAKTTAAREDIGLIRILDNYSFVQVRDTKADEIIKALTGIKFRGRTLNVNYAKPRAGEADGENL